MRIARGFIQALGISPLILVAATCLPGLAQYHEAWGQKATRKAIPAANAPNTLPRTYEVAKGDTLFRVAGKFRTQGVTLNQMVLGLYRANPDAFLNGQINQLVVGRVLAIPGQETLISVDPAQATLQVRALIAKPAPPIPPVSSPAPEPPPVSPAPAIAPGTKARVGPKALMPEQAAAQLKQGLESERNGDLRAALKAYLASAEAGNGEAQKRLGDMYNTGNEFVQRDYETALKWYQKARAQGVEIPKPITNPGPRH